MSKDKSDTVEQTGAPRGSILIGRENRNRGLEILIKEVVEPGPDADIPVPFLILGPGDGDHHELLALWVGKWCTAKDLEEYLGQGKKTHDYTVSRGSLAIKGRGESWNESPEKARAAAGDEGYFDPSSLEDSRQKCLTTIYRRQGQPEFRQAVMRAYGGRCAVTGCDAIDALEAAHIYPYTGRDSNHITNGLLLRADIHTLFDLHLLGICPSNSTIVLSEVLRRGAAYREFEGRTIARPVDEKHHPSTLSLKRRWMQFLDHASTQRE